MCFRKLDMAIGSGTAITGDGGDARDCDGGGGGVSIERLSVQGQSSLCYMCGLNARDFCVKVLHEGILWRSLTFHLDYPFGVIRGF